MHAGDGNIFIFFLRCKAPAVVNKQHQVLLKIFVEKALEERVYTCRKQQPSGKLQIPGWGDSSSGPHDTSQRWHWRHSRAASRPQRWPHWRATSCWSSCSPWAGSHFPSSCLLSVSPAEADSNLQVADGDEGQRDKYWSINREVVKRGWFILEG